MPTPTRSGYTFQGWYTSQSGGSKVSSSTKITGNTTIYAQWKQNAAPDPTATLAEITSAKGYDEGIMLIIKRSKNDTVKVSYSKDKVNWIPIDQELVRARKDEEVRADIVGLVAGTYSVKAEGSNGGLSQKDNIKVTAYDRSGYAHFEKTGVAASGIGAYNDDGTLKANTIVVYVKEATKNTVQVNVDGKTYTGLGSILKNASTVTNGGSRPLDIRVIGKISAPQITQIIVPKLDQVFKVQIS